MAEATKLEGLVFDNSNIVDECALLSTFLVCRSMRAEDELISILRKAAKLVESRGVLTAAKLAICLKDKETLLICLERATGAAANTIVGYLAELARKDPTIKNLLFNVLSSTDGRSKPRYLRLVVRTITHISDAAAYELLDKALNGELSEYARCFVLEHFQGEKVLLCALDMLEDSSDPQAITMLFDIILKNMRYAQHLEDRIISQALKFIAAERSTYTATQAALVLLCFDKLNETLFHNVIDTASSAAYMLQWTILLQLPVGKKNLESLLNMIDSSVNCPSARRALPFVYMLRGDMERSMFCGDYNFMMDFLSTALTEAVDMERRLADERLYVC